MHQTQEEANEKLVIPAAAVKEQLTSCDRSASRDYENEEQHRGGIVRRFLGNICKKVLTKFPALAKAIHCNLEPDLEAQRKFGQLEVPSPTTAFFLEILTVGLKSTKNEEKIKKQQEEEAEKLAEKKKEEEARKHIEEQLCQFEFPSSISMEKVREILNAGKFNQFTALIQKIKNGGEVTEEDMIQCGMSPIEFNRSFQVATLKAVLPKKNFNRESATVVQ